MFDIHQLYSVFQVWFGSLAQTQWNTVECLWRYMFTYQPASNHVMMDSFSRFFCAGRWNQRIFHLRNGHPVIERTSLPQSQMMSLEDSPKVAPFRSIWQLVAFPSLKKYARVKWDIFPQRFGVKKGTGTYLKQPATWYRWTLGNNPVSNKSSFAPTLKPNPSFLKG